MGQRCESLRFDLPMMMKSKGESMHSPREEAEMTA